jgi:FkbM family methyltransferase
MQYLRTVQLIALRAIRSLRRARRMRRLRIPLAAPYPEAAYRDISDAFLTHVGRSVGSVLDVGANFGQCAAFLAARNSIPDGSVVCVEAHPRLAEYLRIHHPFQALEGAVGSGLESREFLARPIDLPRTTFVDVLRGRIGTSTRPGMSSLLVHGHDDNFGIEKIRVDPIALGQFLEENDLEFDLAKIDVEGAALEALLSLGDNIARLGSIHIESETRQIWEGQSLWRHVREHLETKGFELILFRLDRHFLQCESFWIRGDLVRSFLDA